MDRFCSIFSQLLHQLLQLFYRVEFQHIVTVTRAERHAKGFTCWGQFVAMLFCQLGRAHTLREIPGGLQIYLFLPEHPPVCYTAQFWEVYLVFLRKEAMTTEFLFWNGWRRPARPQP